MSKYFLHHSNTPVVDGVTCNDIETMLYAMSFYKDASDDQTNSHANPWMTNSVWNIAEKIFHAEQIVRSFRHTVKHSEAVQSTVENLKNRDWVVKYDTEVKE